ncbi:hypothetical protein D3C81_2072370 [compost metagenome]
MRGQARQDLLDCLVDGAEVHLGLLSLPWVQGLDMNRRGFVACAKTKPAMEGGLLAIQPRLKARTFSGWPL